MIKLPGETPATENTAFDLPLEGVSKENFVPISTEFLIPEKVCDFPIYIYHSSRKRFILFKQETLPIRSAQLEQLTKKGTREVYTTKDFEFHYYQYLVDNLPSVVGNQMLSTEDRTRQVMLISTAVLQRIFENPPDNNTIIQTAFQISDALCDLISSDPLSLVQLNQLRQYDYYTYTHSINVCVFGIGLIRQMDSEIHDRDLKDITRGLLLHDIGKCDIPPYLVNKKGPLNEEEWKTMKNHPVWGYRRLRDSSEISENSRRIALLHHESYDGSGYPTGISGPDIPFTSRICKVTDVFDALTSHRSYKRRINAFEALQLMRDEMNHQLDQDILKQFILFLGKLG
ncbi:MAG: HD-GYP domain-containing protein [bacterium]